MDPFNLKRRFPSDVVYRSPYLPIPAPNASNGGTLDSLPSVNYLLSRDASTGSDSALPSIEPNDSDKVNISSLSVTPESSSSSPLSSIESITLSPEANNLEAISPDTGRQRELFTVEETDHVEGGKSQAQLRREREAASWRSSQGVINGTRKSRGQAPKRLMDEDINTKTIDAKRPKKRSAMESQVKFPTQDGTASKSCSEPIAVFTGPKLPKLHWFKLPPSTPKSMTPKVKSSKAPRLESRRARIIPTRTKQVVSKVSSHTSPAPEANEGYKLPSQPEETLLLRPYSEPQRDNYFVDPERCAIIPELQGIAYHDSSPCDLPIPFDQAKSMLKFGESNPHFDEEEKTIFQEKFFEPSHRKNFSKIAESLPNRNFQDCIDYYYSNKHKLSLGEKLRALIKQEEDSKKKLRAPTNKKKDEEWKWHQDMKLIDGDMDEESKSRRQRKRVTPKRFLNEGDAASHNIRRAGSG